MGGCEMLRHAWAVQGIVAVPRGSCADLPATSLVACRGVVVAVDACEQQDPAVIVEFLEYVDTCEKESGAGDEVPGVSCNDTETPMLDITGCTPKASVLLSISTCLGLEDPAEVWEKESAVDALAPGVNCTG